MPILLLLLVGGAAAAAIAASSAPDKQAPAAPTNRSSLSIEEQFRLAQQQSDKARMQREKDAWAEFNRDKKLAFSVPVLGSLWEAAYNAIGGDRTMRLMAGFGKAIANWNAPDWNSEENKKRLSQSIARINALTLAPIEPIEGATDDYFNYSKQLDGLSAAIEGMFKARPDRLAFWNALTSWVSSNASNPYVLNVTQSRIDLPEGKSFYAWPMLVDPRASVQYADRDPNYARLMAAATLAAGMRGKDPVAVREYVRKAYAELRKKSPELGYSNNTGWLFGGMLDILDSATK